MKIHATAAVARFSCLQGECPDTCCKGWSMQLDDATYAAYQGKDLENAVAYDGEIRVMRRDPETDYCVKFSEGICAIHRDYGAPMLGDACNFYPRVTRNFGRETIMTASLSCPEIARLALYETSSEFVEIETERLPSSLNNYQDTELSAEQSLKIHASFLNATASAEAPETVMARIYSAALSLSRVKKSDWPDAAAFFLRTADSRLPQPIIQTSDKYKVMQIFMAVIHGTGKKKNTRLLEVFTQVENHYGIKLNWADLTLSLDNTRSPAAANHEILRKYIAAQISFTSFPFAGLGNDIVEKAKLLCFKFALVKFMLGGINDEAEIVKTVQTVSRVIDHIAAPDLIFKLMEDFDWISEARIIGLLSA